MKKYTILEILVGLLLLLSPAYALADVSYSQTSGNCDDITITTDTNGDDQWDNGVGYYLVNPDGLVISQIYNGIAENGIAPLCGSGGNAVFPKNPGANSNPPYPTLQPFTNLPAGNYKYIILGSDTPVSCAFGPDDGADYGIYTLNGDGITPCTLDALNGAGATYLYNGTDLAVSGEITGGGGGGGGGGGPIGLSGIEDTFNAGFASTTGLGVHDVVAWSGDSLIKLFIGSGLSVLYFLRWWIVALVVIGLCIFFAFRAFRFFKH